MNKAHPGKYANRYAKRPQKCRTMHGPGFIEAACLAGVYVILGPAGVYVGSAQCVYLRNSQVTKLGLDWLTLVPMPGASQLDRQRVERTVADVLAEEGLVVVSNNTTLRRRQIGADNSARMRGNKIGLGGKGPRGKIPWNKGRKLKETQ